MTTDKVYNDCMAWCTTSSVNKCSKVTFAKTITKLIPVSQKKAGGIVMKMREIPMAALKTAIRNEARLDIDFGDPASEPTDPAGDDEDIAGVLGTM